MSVILKRRKLSYCDCVGNDTYAYILRNVESGEMIANCYVIIDFNNSKAYISNVNSFYPNKGYCQMLLKDMLFDIKHKFAIKTCAVVLASTIDNALHLFKKIEFTEVSRKPYDPNCDAITMEIQLN